MRYIDLTHILKNKTPVYPGDPEFSLKNMSNKEDSYSLFKIEANLHCGTHIDAPYHYFKDSKMVNDLELDSLIGKASVLKWKYNVDYNKKISKNNINTHINNHRKIYVEDIEITERLEKIVILKTGWFNNINEKDYFTNNFYISKELAKLFIKNEISGIAIDTPSVDKYGKNKIHKLFLKKNIWIVENLTNMNQLKKDSYYSYFIPMNIESEASFVRAFVKI